MSAGATRDSSLAAPGPPLPGGEQAADAQDVAEGRMRNAERYGPERQGVLPVRGRQEETR